MSVTIFKKMEFHRHNVTQKRSRITQFQLTFTMSTDFLVSPDSSDVSFVIFHWLQSRCPIYWRRKQSLNSKHWNLQHLKHFKINCHLHRFWKFIILNNLDTELHTDASKIGFGAILLQRQTNGDLHPVSFFSKRSTEAESRKHSFELEALAVIYSVKRFHVYLHGIPFRIVTDCLSFK